MNENEAKHLQALIRAKKGRLHQLELKEARFGLDVPPHIPIEIEELRGYNNIGFRCANGSE